MIVVVLTVVPEKLRGDLTRWLLEISPGVYVGVASARVRERLWGRIIDLTATGRAIMVYAARNEQRLKFNVLRHHWETVDLDGVTLMRRPADDAPPTAAPKGWSVASKRRRFTR